MPEAAGPTPPPVASRRRTWAYFILTLVAVQLVGGPKIQLSQWGVRAADNAGIAEGVSWLNGRLDIPHPGRDPATNRMHDTGYFNGKVYNVFPPLAGFLTVTMAPIHRLLEHPIDLWLPWAHVAVLFIPIPILGYAVFRRRCGDDAWAGLLTVMWIAGTAMLPCLEYTRRGHLGPMDHIFTQIGLMLLAWDLLGRQRIWPALIGLAIATWSRQMTFLYAFPLCWIAWRRGLLGWAILGVALVAAPLLALNYAKFGNPLDFGYQYIYVNRSNELMADRYLAHGVFSPYFIPENLYYLTVAPSPLEMQPMQVRIVANPMGTGMFLTSPILLLALIGARRWWAEPEARALMLGSLAVIGGLLMYHSPGFLQLGYNRFALDFIPIWMAVLAPLSRRGRWPAFTLGCAAWSLLYFHLLPPVL